jgi:dihydroflavonol-4-reductase
VTGDIRDQTALDSACLGVHTVFHLAAVSRYNSNLADGEYYSVNVEGTRQVLESSVRARCRRLVFVSTIEAMGVSDGAALTETSVSRPRNVYGASKLAAEGVVQEYCRKGSINASIVRIGTTFGPGNTLVYDRIIRPISHGIYILFGHGASLCEFSFVGNQVYGLWLAAERGVNGELYLMSDEHPYRFCDVVNEVARQVHASVRIFRLPVWTAWPLALAAECAAKIFPFYTFYIKQTGRAFFSRKTLEWLVRSSMYFDIRKAREELGYVQPYSLTEGLAATVSWYRSAGLMP